MAEKLEDLNLPISVVSRLVKEALPDGVAIAKEARTGLAKVASVFVLYVTSASTNVAKKAGRKTLTGQDVLDAMEDIEFEKFIGPLKESLESYKASLKAKKGINAAKKKEQSNEKDSESVTEQGEVEA